MQIKWFLLAVIVLVIAGVLVFRPWKHAVTVPTGAHAGDLLLKPCTIKLDKVNYRADCGTLVVPENRSNPTARLIALPVKRIHSASATPAEPVFYLSGGPGSSNMGFKPPAWLLADHDVVMVGYRGVDGTPKLDCPGVSKAIRGVGGDLLRPASLDALGAAMAACASQLQAAGVDLAGYTIPEVVGDMESARAALGYPAHQPAQ